MTDPRPPVFLPLWTLAVVATASAFVVHLAFFAMQAGAWFLAGFCFIILPQIRRLPDDLLALWVEAKCPKFDHRLISAVQLNRPRAKLAGMSQELVGIIRTGPELDSPCSPKNPIATRDHIDIYI